MGMIIPGRANCKVFRVGKYIIRKRENSIVISIKIYSYRFDLEV